MTDENRAKRILSTILFNALWIVPIALMIFARAFPEQFDRFWEKLFGN